MEDTVNVHKEALGKTALDSPEANWLVATKQYFPPVRRKQIALQPKLHQLIK
jgi:hypothetical protein